MPTAYTNTIYKGYTFEEFMLNISRAFNFRTREFSLETLKTIEEIKPELDYYQEELEKRKKDLKLMKGLNLTKQKALYQQTIEMKLKQYNQGDIKTKEEEKQLNEMLSKVKQWNPPKMYEGLKKYAIEQIEGTIKFDIHYYPDEPQPSFDEWKESYTKKLEADIYYYHKQISNEIERAKEATDYLINLRKNLKTKKARNADIERY